MRACVQRVTDANVTVGGEVVGKISDGLVVLLGVAQGDTEDQARHLADRICGLRIFSDEAGKMNRSLVETGHAMLVVSQFTLCADVRKGRRPSFTDAAPPELAERLYEIFVASVGIQGVRVETGQFRQHMSVALVNDGPVTFIVES